IYVGSGFFISSFCQFHLFHKSLTLVYWIIQFTICIRNFFTAYHQFKSLGEAWIISVHFTKRTHFLWIVCDKSGLNKMWLSFFSEYFVYRFASIHGFINLYSYLNL